MVDHPRSVIAAPLIHLWLTALYKSIYLLTYLIDSPSLFLKFWIDHIDSFRDTAIQFISHKTQIRRRDNERWRYCQFMGSMRRAR